MFCSVCVKSFTWTCWFHFFVSLLLSWDWIEHSSNTFWYLTFVVLSGLKNTNFCLHHHHMMMALMMYVVVLWTDSDEDRVKGGLSIAATGGRKEEVAKRRKWFEVEMRSEWGGNSQEWWAAGEVGLMRSRWEERRVRSEWGEAVT